MKKKKKNHPPIEHKIKRSEHILKFIDQINTKVLKKQSTNLQIKLPRSS